MACKYCRVEKRGSPCDFCGEQISRAEKWNQPWCQCELCARVTLMMGTKRCDRCWELEGRIRLDPFLALAVMVNHGILEFLLDGKPAIVRVPTGIQPQRFFDEVARGQPLFLRVRNLTPEGNDVLQDQSHDSNVGAASVAGAQAREDQQGRGS